MNRKGELALVSRQHALGLVGRPVIAHHRDGSMYHGILHSVTGDGIYMQRMGGRTISGNPAESTFENADMQESTDLDAEEVFFPFFFFPFFALAALSSWWW